MFPLLRYFSISGGIATALFTLLFSIGYLYHERLEIIDSGEAINILLGRALSNSLRPHLQSYLDVSVSDTPATLQARQETTEIRDLITQLSKELPILKVKLYTLNGLTVFSTSANEIGTIKQPNSGFLSAINGEPASKLAFGEDKSRFSGVFFDKSVVETYLSMPDNTGQTSAVFEIYYDVSDMLLEAYQDVSIAIILVIISFFIMFAILAGIVRRADSIIKKQYQQLIVSEEQLQVANENLEQTVQQRTSELAQTIEQLEKEIQIRTQAEQELVKLTQAVEQSPASVMITDPTGKITYVNPKFIEVMGYSFDETLFMSLQDMESAALSDQACDGLWETITSGREWRGETLSKKKDGEAIWESVTISSIKEANGGISGFLAVKEDITLRKEYERQLLKQANYDELTGLANRLLATDRLEQALVRSDRYDTYTALLFIDLDDFMTVNDTLGHAFGDQLLCIVSKRLEAILRNSDTVARISNLEFNGTVARMGGDEFTIILPDLSDPLHAEIVAKHILDNLSKSIVLDDREIFLTASIGITVYPTDGNDAQDLMRNADIAMYHSKSVSRNNFHFFTSEMNEKALARLELDSELRGALERDEFEMHFQPLISNTSGTVVGAEALLRWNSRRFGMVSPDCFIPLAENTGLIRKIGNWCLQQSCIAASSWMTKSGQTLYVAVNISSHQLQDGDFAETVSNTLQEVKLEPARLVLEITESTILESSPRIKETIFSIQKIGVRFAIDDFGTGYSSLSYLKRFPFDILKIDRTFINGIVDSSDDLNLVSAIVAMARSLRLSIVAEGIETSQQLQHVKTLGCDMSQGWLLGKAIPNSEFTKIIDNDWSNLT